MLKKKFKAGFTLYELLISISIVGIILGIVLYNHSKFETDIEITNLGYRVALAVRQAQVSSISVKQFIDISGGRFDVPHGLHFNKDADNSFIFFADANGDGLYTPQSGGFDMDCVAEAGSECVEKISIGHNNKIKGFCGISWSADPADVQPCAEFGSGTYQMLDIKFKRPNPDAIFRVYPVNFTATQGDGLPPYGFDSSTGTFNESAATTKACVNNSNGVACDGWAICLISPQGREKRVVVYNTGQISVENVTPNTNEPCSSITP